MDTTKDERPRGEIAVLDAAGNVIAEPGRADLDTRTTERTAADCVRLYLARLAPSARVSQRSRLNTAARILGARDAFSAPWHELTPEGVSTLRAMLAERYAPRSVNATLAGVFRVLRLCDRYGLLSRPLSHLTDPDAEGRSAYVSTKDARQHGRALDAGEVAALYQAAVQDDNAARGARNAAALALCHGGGLRRAEACGVHVADLDLTEGAAAVTVTKAKGGAARTVPLPEGAAHYLRAWLAVRGDDGGPLLLPVTKAGTVVHGHDGGRVCGRCGRVHLSPQALGAALSGGKRYGRTARGLAHRAGVSFRSHDLRRTAITTQLDAGADPLTVARNAGHSSVNTTKAYDRRPFAAQRKAAAAVHVPIVDR